MLDERNEKISELELANMKLANKTIILAQENALLEEENRQLVEAAEKAKPLWKRMFKKPTYVEG